MDTVGFILLKSLFCASITGNLVKIAQITERMSNVTGYIVITIAYGLGSGTTRVLSTFLKSRRGVDLPLVGIIIFVTEIVWLIAAMLVGSFLENLIAESADMNTWSVIVTGVLFSMAMGTQAGAASNVFTSFPNTTGMTASVASACSAACSVLMLYARLHQLSCCYLPYEDYRKLSERTDIETNKAERMLLVEKSSGAIDELSKQTFPLVFFILGAFAGAYSSSKIKFWCLAVPILIVIIMIVELYLQILKNDENANRPISADHQQITLNQDNGEAFDLIPSNEGYPEYEI